MNTKLAARFAAVTIAATSILGIAAGSANAATLRCNAANKGRIVQTNVCSYQKGRYAWVKIVPQADVLTVDSESVSPSEIQGVTFSSSDGAFTATLLPSFTIASNEYTTFFNAYPTAKLTKFGFSSASIRFGVTSLTRQTNSDAVMEMNEDADDYSVGIRSVLSRQVLTVKGRTVARFSWIQNSDPTYINTDTYIDTLDGEKMVVIRTSYDKSDPKAPSYRADFDRMVAAVVVR
jgi:hypothetical protein